MDGVLIIDKPCGPTSHDIVAVVRRATGWTKVGHTGTLDPMATGVLALVVGRATRLAQFLSAADKVYEAEVRLGWATDTYDAQGAPIDVSAPDLRATSGSSPHARTGPDGDTAPATRQPAITDAELERALERFRGTYDQAAPPFSAKRVDGVRSYELARKGKPTHAREARVTVHELSCLGRTTDRVRLRLTCSAGFYVRTFAHELGGTLGIGAHLSALRRLRSGEFALADAVPLDAIELDRPALFDRLVPLERLLTSLPSVIVTSAGAVRTHHGNVLRPQDLTTMPAETAGRVRVLNEAGKLLAIADARAGLLHPAVVVG